MRRLSHMGPLFAQSLAPPRPGQPVRRSGALVLLQQAGAWWGVLMPSIVSIVSFTVIVNADFARHHGRPGEGAGDLDTVADSLSQEVGEGQRHISQALDGG